MLKYIKYFALALSVLSMSCVIEAKTQNFSNFNRSNQNQDSGILLNTQNIENTVTVKAAPSGVYHSGSIIKKANQRSIVTSSINTQSFISGTLVRVHWDLINPSEGVYDFSSIEKELEQASLYDSSISLVVLDSKTMPQFVLEQCEIFEYEFRGDASQTCLPWDLEYQRHKASLLSSLGQQFDSHPNLLAVYFTYAAMSNGVEMHFRVDEDAFNASGYTEDKLVAAYNNVMDMYADAFKETSIIMEVHEVFNSPYLAEETYDYCFDKLGSRCGVAIWWCASRMATNPRQSEYMVYPVAQLATEQSFAVCQTVGNFTDQPDRFDQGQGWTTEEAFLYEMNFFISEGFTVFELWSKDIKNEIIVEMIKEDVIPNL